MFSRPHARTHTHTGVLIESLHGQCKSDCGAVGGSELDDGEREQASPGLNVVSAALARHAQRHDFTEHQEDGKRALSELCDCVGVNSSAFIVRKCPFTHIPPFKVDPWPGPRGAHLAACCVPGGVL